jgi:hypothetical protein
MPNNEQIIIEDSVTISGDITVDGLEEGNELTQQVVNNTQLLNSMLKQLKEINKTLKKIYQ